MLIRHTIEAVDRRVPVMVGISHASFKTSIELAHFFRRPWCRGRAVAGAPASFRRSTHSIRPDCLFRSGSTGDQAPDNSVSQSRSGCGCFNPRYDCPRETAERAVHQGKFADLARVSRLIVEIDHAGHARYFTTMQMLLATLQLGGSGATMPPPSCEIARRVIDAFAAKDYERAATLQLQLRCSRPNGCIVGWHRR